MPVQDRIHSKIEKARLLIKVAAASAGVSFVLSMMVLFSGIVNPWAGMDVYALSFVPLTISFIFSLLALMYGLLGKRAAQEDEEKLLLERRKEKVGTFNVSEDVRFTAGRTFSNYSKYAQRIVSVLLPITILLSVIFLYWWAWNARVAPIAPVNPMSLAVLSGLVMCMAVFLGAFLNGQSHDSEFRWLRPVGAWLMVSFVTLLLATVAATFLELQNRSMGTLPPLDPYFRNFIFWFYVVLSAELMLNYIAEFYRPRTLEEERPIFESRLLSLFTEPGGVMRNVAETLDYQFGFKVSRTWIYSFAERSLFPLLALWLLTLWLFTCISEVAPGEIGIRERWSRVIETPLEPGIYLKLPWPMERIVRCPVDRIQEIIVGPEMKNAAGVELRPEVVLWTKQHYAQDARFLVATDKKEGSSGKDIPVSILSASVSVQFRVKKSGIFDYVYGHFNAPKLLMDICERAVSNYFVSVDMMKVMAKERQEVVKELHKRIQAKADAEKLGIEILSISLHDAHPPVEEVAASFQDVIGAREEKAAMILGANTEKISLASEATSEAIRKKLESETYKKTSIQLAEAESERFERQLEAYLAAPSIFKLRSYLDFLENEAKSTRKYIISSSIPSQIYEINLEETTRLDLLDAKLGDIQGN